MPQFVVVFTPEQTREYGSPDVVGPFDSIEAAENHLAIYMETAGGWNGEVVEMENPHKGAT